MVSGSTYRIGVSQIMIAGQNEGATKERWQEILHCRERFLSAKKIPESYLLNSSIKKSWIKARKQGVDPAHVAIERNMELYDESNYRYHDLIEITRELTVPFSQYLAPQGYLLFLVDNKEMILLNVGHWGKSDAIPMPEHVCWGVIADSKAMGTSSHELCLSLGQPVQLLGPEHYCQAFQKRIASAAPIKDLNKRTVAALVVLSPVLSILTNDQIHYYSVNGMCMVSSLAVAIESQYKLRSQLQQNDASKSLQKRIEITQLKIANLDNALAKVISLIPDGMLIVDDKGKIKKINDKALQFFKLKKESLTNRNLSEFIDDYLSIMTKAKEGEGFSVDRYLKTTNRPKICRINIYPILNNYRNELSFAAIQFHAERSSVETKIMSTAVYCFDDILGKSGSMAAALQKAKRFSRSNENILLQGESGTGKELFAQAIHRDSRPAGPFVAVNCAAFPHDLIGSELFGYEGGSFTGAQRCGKPGKIELANGGTLFLDEIGDMPLDLQAILLRALQDKQIVRIGGSSYKQIDFRLITATNKDLCKMVEENKFREDLFYRLSVLSVFIPSLRERKDDIELLSRFFLENYCRDNDFEIPQITSEAINMLNNYRWPGNVRQLQNAIHHAVNVCDDGLIEAAHLPSHVVKHSRIPILNSLSHLEDGACADLDLESIERKVIVSALECAKNNVQDAARLCGLSRTTLYRRLKKYNIDIEGS